MLYYLLTPLALATFLFSKGSLADIKKIPLLPSSKVVEVADGSGGIVRCTTAKKRYYVEPKGKKYILGKYAIELLASKVGSARGREKSRFNARLKLLKRAVKLGNSICQKKSSDSNVPIGSGSLTQLNRPLTREDITYFLDKAGFGLSSEEEFLVPIGVNQGIESFVTEFMKFHSEPTGLLERVNDRVDGQIGNTTTQTPTGQRQALLDLWIHTRNPYAEKFALFLLSVWTVGGDVIEDETFRGSFWDYYTRLREYAAADTSIPDLAVQIGRDPLMLIYLNNELNVKGSANENYARELMELFTLGTTSIEGVPNYSETKSDGSGDIAVAARMLTGWKVKKNYQTNKLEASYDASRHASGPHTMFAGEDYAFVGENDEDLERGIFAHHPGAAPYYAKEILKEYLTPYPSKELIQNFAQVINQNGFKLRPSMATLFQSEAFFDPAYRDTLPTNAVEIAAKIARLLELRGAINVSYVDYELLQTGMLFNFTPSVFWYNPTVWNSSSVLLAKANVVAEMLNDHTAQSDGGWSAAKVLPQGVATPREVINFAIAKLGLFNVSEVQKQNLDGYFKLSRQSDNTYLPFMYNNLSADHQARKGLGAYYILFTLPSFQLR